ncbi:hypothetical protein L798_13160 [Zootermopsis nevadensis]|uniref:Uncharacterized protein n=2 Tax=Zootermopsis nevadensis TaxID=136037 RepID=A0A067QT33_ZOONE|nr:hypothetical protein L798_13160 [Zootermopsis nevadensis]
MTWNGMEVKERRGRPKNHVHVSEEEKLARQRERNRLCKRCSRASKSQEATSRERERNRLYMRKFRASLRNELERDRDKAHKHMAFMFVTPELSELCGEDDVEMWHERNRKARRKPIIALIPQQLEWQREQKRIYIMKFCASLSDEELERRREKDRLLKRRAKEIMKERKQDITFQGGSQAQHHILQNRNFWNYAALAKEQNLLI